MRACIKVVRNQLADSNPQFDPAALAETVEPEYASELLLAASAFKVEGVGTLEGRGRFLSALLRQEGRPTQLLGLLLGAISYAWRRSWMNQLLL